MPGALKPNPPGEAKPERLSKYIKRMRTVLRRGSISKSVSGPESAPNTEGRTERQAGHTTATTTATEPPIRTPTPKPTTTTTTNQPVVISHWGAIQEERTRALFAKYGLTLSQDDLRPVVDNSVQRVAKSIRMRVRRSCHRCQTVFTGPDRVCVNCQHTRCKSCPRHPAPRPKEDSEAALRKILAQKGKATQQQHGQHGQQGQARAQVQRQGQKQTHRGDPNNYVLKIPSRSGGQDLVRRPIRQRVRRTCHRCQSMFAAESKQCSECQHVRCKKCPRDPPKLDKYPDGYPGDVDPPPDPPARTWKKPRRRVRYTCHQCSTLYRSGQKICAECGQERCAETLRDPPERVRPESDPEVVRKVEERLARLRLTRD